jgi:hypothetical protein
MTFSWEDWNTSSICSLLRGYAEGSHTHVNETETQGDSQRKPSSDEVTMHPAHSLVCSERIQGDITVCCRFEEIVTAQLGN